MSSKQYKFENPDRLTQEQLWLLATSSPLAQFRKERSDTLMLHGSVRDKEVLDAIVLCMKRDWEIKTKKNLLQTIKDLPNTPTFTNFMQGWKYLSPIELHALDKYDDRLKALCHTFTMTNYYQFDLTDSGDLAWHLGRNAWIIRTGAHIGLLTEDEAWKLLEENGALIKNAFKNWEEFGISYTIGAQYWQREEFSVPQIKYFKDTLIFLLTNENSPWLHVNWH